MFHSSGDQTIIAVVLLHVLLTYIRTLGDPTIVAVVSTTCAVLIGILDEVLNATQHKHDVC